MHLYLKSGEDERWLTVQLVEGNLPRIAGLSDDNTVSTAEDFEPALWFKATVLESMTIDCDKRVACWRNLTADKQSIKFYFIFFSFIQRLQSVNTIPIQTINSKV